MSCPSVKFSICRISGYNFDTATHTHTHVKTRNQATQTPSNLYIITTKSRKKAGINMYH